MPYPAMKLSSLPRHYKKFCFSLAILLAISFKLNAPSGVSAHGHSHDDDHGHSHGEPEENPSFKWSRAANVQEDEIMEDEIVDLPPKKGPTPKVKVVHQEHNHGGHGHSHGGHGHSHGPPQQEPTPEEREKFRQKLHKEWDDEDEDVDVGRNVWLQAISATLLISAAPFFILFFIPLDNTPEKRSALKITLSFASGGLLGDAFLHLIPHAMMAAHPVGDGTGHGHSHSHGHSHGGGHSHGEGNEHDPHDMSVGLGVLCGILAFLAVEKFVRIMNEGGHGHSHAVVEKKQPVEQEASVTKKEEATPSKSSKSPTEKTKKLKSSDDESEVSDEVKDDHSDAETVTRDPTTKESEIKEKEAAKTSASVATVEEAGEIKVAGYLNLVADGFHNFTDGLAIGASFAAGQGVGMVTTFTILFHEIPHEIGDYAILIQSGVSPMKAKLLQSFTAIGALLGCIVALAAQGGDFGSSSIILPFTAGGFIYIATVSVIPELLEGASSFAQSVKEIIALILGVVMMVIIAQYE